MTADALQQRLNSLADPRRAVVSARFFKTGAGEYGEGDQFLGINAATMHKIAREFRTLPLPGIQLTLDSPWHEHRLTALLILVLQYRKADVRMQKKIYDLYLARTSRINNWDLVDSSAPHIVGAHLHGRKTTPLDRLAKSSCLWERRIAIVATQHSIRKGVFTGTLHIAERLLGDTEDLIHKAAGWMLREVGERDEACLESFLRRHLRAMPRTMLRYAIEHFDVQKRKAYLTGTIEIPS